MSRLAGLALLLALAGCSGTEPADPEPAAEPAAREPAPEVARGPERLEPDALGAEPLADLPLRLADGRASSLGAALGDARALVIAYTSLRCPVTRLYAPGWGPLGAELAEREVALLLVDPMQVDDDPDVLAAAEEHGWTAPVARDPEGALTEALDARRTADVFLLDRELRVRYRGAKDDQYGIGYRLAAPRERYLADALDALLAGEPIAVPATEAPGCKLNR